MQAKFCVNWDKFIVHQSVTTVYFYDLFFLLCREFIFEHVADVTCLKKKKKDEMSLSVLPWKRLAGRWKKNKKRPPARTKWHKAATINQKQTTISGNVSGLHSERKQPRSLQDEQPVLITPQRVTRAVKLQIKLVTLGERGPLPRPASPFDCLCIGRSKESGGGLKKKRKYVFLAELPPQQSGAFSRSRASYGYHMSLRVRPKQAGPHVGCAGWTRN